MTGTLPKVDLNVDNFELWMTVMSAVESADQIWWWIIVVMVHIHHSQPLKIKFGKNHFLGSATLGPKQYRKGVKREWYYLLHIPCKQDDQSVIQYKYRTSPNVHYNVLTNYTNLYLQMALEYVPNIVGSLLLKEKYGLQKYVKFWSILLSHSIKSKVIVF